ncbi:MAG: type II toxin-antitoxin system death-on-curing family toxin [Fibrobacterota bacterium]|nr:type II toxin-antitoxin system death-on-curing family toxin [Fibrobacterota bacterium]QQS06571.1 MAG: type II toxin-antitoxin system death-on-curing family toxin [Fibrobacterota bacterium]
MIDNLDDCVHLDLDIVLEIHQSVIDAFGGAQGIREIALLESAVAAPQATFGGQSVYVDVVEIAAAYLFFLCRNHPFIDGNKRVSLASCLVFLRLNGYSPAPDSSAWEELTLDIAASRLDRDQATQRLRALLPG